MLIELGNHSALRGVDDRPKVTTIHVPEFDDGSTHPDAEYEGGRDELGWPQGKLLRRGPRLGGYTHEPGLSVEEFRRHRQEALDLYGGVTHLPEHELLQCVVNAWPEVATSPPAWVRVSSHEETHGPVSKMRLPAGHPKPDPHPRKHCDDVESFLREFYRLPDSAERPADFEDRYWTRHGEPGVAIPSLPDARALYTNQGRAISNINDGGGKVGLTGTGTAATATSLTTGTAMALNEWAGYRVYCMQTATGPIVWANVLSNTTGGVLTVDRWYSAATPGGSAPAAPSAGWYYMLADGGAVSTWFVGLTTTNITPAAADNFLSGEYTTAGGGMIRKIAPYAQTSGVATRSITLTPVFTVNASDSPLPSTFYAIGVFAGMVVTTVSPFTPYKFETSLNASFQVGAIGDQGTITETISGS